MHGTFAANRDDSGLEFTPRHHPTTPASNDLRCIPADVRGRPVRFGAPLLSRGGLPLSGRAPRMANDDQGRLRVESPAFVEEYESSEDGVELRWHFDKAPAGRGALEVRIPVPDADFRGTTAGGLHFGAGDLLVRVGHGTWVDARGRRSPVPAAFERGAIVLSVPSQLLSASSFPAVLDPTIGPEFQLDAPTYGPSPFAQVTPDIACGTTNCLVTWADLRGGNPESDLYAARLNPAGAVLDPLGIPVSTGFDAQVTPAVAWDGTNYFVVWTDLNVFGSIAGTRVSADGVVLDPSALRVDTGSAPIGRNQALAWNGTHFLVVWTDLRNDPYGDLYGARVTPDGGVVDVTGFPISSGPKGQSNASIAWDGTEFLVAWTEFDSSTFDTDVRAARVTAGGAVLDPNGIVVATSPTAREESPSVSWNGSHFLVAWSEFQNVTDFDIAATRVSRAGLVLDSPAIRIVTAPNRQLSPEVISDGTNWLVAWSDARTSPTESDIYATRVSPGGAVLDASGFVVSGAPGEQLEPSFAWNGTHAVFAWTDSRRGTDVFGARVTATGAVLEPTGIAISTALNGQFSPALASDGTNWLVIWQDNRGGGFDVLGARVAPSGSVLDPIGFLVSTTPNSRSPEIAWGGTNFLVVWWDGSFTNSRGIVGARISPQGVVLDSNGIGISTGAGQKSSPTVAWGGSTFLVTWEDYRQGAGADIYGARVSAGGLVLDPLGVPISTAPNDQIQPAVAWTGSRFLVAWSDTRNGRGSRDIYAAGVSASGVLDASELVICNAANDQYNPRLACNPQNCLVTWSDARNRPNIFALYGGRVNDAGVQDGMGFPIMVSPTFRPAASLDWDGANTVVTWAEYDAAGLSAVVGTRITPTNANLDSNALALAPARGNQSDPKLACNRGTCLIAYVSATQRVMARFVTTNAMPVATDQAVTTAEDKPVSLTLVGTDPDGDPLSFSLVSTPDSGTLSGTPPALTYEPRPNFSGMVNFTFKVSDGTLDSLPATVSISVTPVDDAPIADSQMLVSSQATALPIRLTGSDPEGATLTFRIDGPPAHGTLSGDPPDVVYLPGSSYAGNDAFTFVVNDGKNDSNSGVVAITIEASTQPARGCGCNEPTRSPAVALAFLIALAWRSRSGRRAAKQRQLQER